MAQQKYVLITGTSSGLGFALAQKISTDGYIVFACVRKEEDKYLWASNSNVIPLILDVTKQDTIKTAYQIVFEKTGGQGLYALINNSGINYLGAFEITDPARNKDVLNVNIIGAMDVTKSMLPLLHKNALPSSNSKIINIGSIGGIFALPWESTYHASKFALLGWSQSLRYELEALNISVCCFIPGGMKTDIFQKSADTTGSLYQGNITQAVFYKNNLDHMVKVMRGFESRATSATKAATVILKLLNKKKVPLKKYFGTDAALIRIFTWLGLQGILKNQFIKK